MKSLIYFIPSAICLLVVFFGFVCVTVAAYGLKKAKANVPPRRTFWWKCFLTVGFVTLLGGLFGVWETGFSVGWTGKSTREWSDGHAPELEALIRKRCVPFMNRGGSVGMTVALVSLTNATVMAFGRPSFTSGAHTRGDTEFEIGSITKTFTALTLARQIELAAVTLEQPIQELLPAGVELPEDTKAVTLRHLTTHTSGFPPLPSNMSPLGVIKMLLFGSNPYAGYTETDLMDGVRTVKLASKPGTKSSYSNFGVTLMGCLLARKAGTNYEALVKRGVCRPLGMDDTTVELDDIQAARFAQGYRVVLRYGRVLFGLRSSPWHDATNLGGDGALRSTGADMLKYLEANMRPEGRPLEHALRESHRKLFQENEQVAFGMNWVRTQNKRLKSTLIWHNGGTGGFMSFLGFTEDGHTGVLILSNTAESVDALGVDLLSDLAGPPAAGE